jgi:hypothetical protein
MVISLLYQHGVSIHGFAHCTALVGTGTLHAEWLGRAGRGHPLYVATIAFVVSTIQKAASDTMAPADLMWRMFARMLMFGLGIFFMLRLLTLEPNEARVPDPLRQLQGDGAPQRITLGEPALRTAIAASCQARRPYRLTFKLGSMSIADRMSRPTLKTKLSLRAHNFNS